MKRYNDQDVKLTEALYLKLRPWSKRHVNMAKYQDESDICCLKCGSTDFQKRGWKSSATLWYQHIYCKACGGWSKVGKGQQVNPITIYE